MEITLTCEQYKNLLLMIYLGNWMINAIKVHPDENFREVASYIYSFADSFGVKGLIDPKPLKGKYFPTQAFDDLTEPYIEEYDNEIFWEELADRLAERDLVREYGKKAIKKMSVEERFGKRSKLADHYEEEFEKHGLDRITIE